MSAKKGLPAKTKMRHDRHYVEDLLSRKGDLLVQNIPLDRIRPNPDQPRKDMGDLQGIAASIQEQGVLEPILVNESQFGYLIVSGERRFQASRLLGLESIPCIIKNLSDGQVLEVALVENLQRKDLHPFEEADGLRMLMDSFQYTHDQIARKIGKSRTSVTETITLAGLAVDVRNAAVAAGISAKSMLLSVARLATEEEQFAMIAEIAKGAGREEVRRQTRRKQRAKPYVFKYRDPERAFSFNLRFRKSDVAPGELIQVLEDVLEDLKREIASEAS